MGYLKTGLIGLCAAVILTGCASEQRALAALPPADPDPLATYETRPAPTAGSRVAVGAQVVAPLPANRVLAPLQLPQAEIDRTYKNHHADLSSSLNSQNAPSLQLAWSVPTDAPVSHTPLVENGRAYFADWKGYAYAVDLASGRTLWKEKIQETVNEKWPWHGIVGTGALGGGLLYEASMEGMAYGIDPETGRTVWQTRITDDPHAGNIGKLTYYDGLVYIGLSSVEEPLTKMQEGFEPNFQGKVKALDARTGEIVWTLPLAVPPADGATVWSSFAIDTTNGVLYFTTSNNYTHANELSDAMVAADAKTGKIYWFDQVTNNDIWTMANPKGPDYAFGAGPQLFEAVIDGQNRALVGAGQKSGVFYVWDRETGQRVWTATVGYGHVGGGIHGEASVGADRIIIWGNNAFPYANPEKHPMDLKAVDPATGGYLWVVPKAQPAVQISAGFLADDVYFVGSLDGMVRGYDANTGQKVWESKKHGSVSSSLWVEDGTLLWGTGVPKQFGGATGQNGVFAYKPSR